MHGKQLNKLRFQSSTAKSWTLKTWEISRVLTCPFFCVTRQIRTFLEIRMSNELVGPEEVAKSLFGKRLDFCGTSRQSVNPRFLSTTSVRLLQAFFVGLGSFCLAIGRLQLDLLRSMKQELELAPRTSFTLSTCTEMALKKRLRNIAAESIGNIVAMKRCLRDVVAIHNTVKSSSRNLTVCKFWVLKIPRLTVKQSQLPAFPEFAAKIAAQRSRHSVTWSSDVSVSLREPLNAMLFIFNSRISSCFFGKSSICHGLWRRIRLINFSSQHRCFFRQRLCLFLTLFRSFVKLFSASEPLSVAENLVSICPTIEMILDLAIVVHVRSLHKLNFEMTTPNIDSASGPRNNWPVYRVHLLFFWVHPQLPEFWDLCEFQSSPQLKLQIYPSGFCGTRPFRQKMSYSIARTSAFNCTEDWDASIDASARKLLWESRCCRCNCSSWKLRCWWKASWFFFACNIAEYFWRYGFVRTPSFSWRASVSAISLSHPICRRLIKWFNTWDNRRGNFCH